MYTLIFYGIPHVYDIDLIKTLSICYTGLMQFKYLQSPVQIYRTKIFIKENIQYLN